jgi:hypothetical protein
MVTAPRRPGPPAAGHPDPPAEPRPDPAAEPRPDPAAEARPDPAAEAGEPTSGLAHLTRILGTIVAPTTLLTSVLFYFGWMHAFWFFDYLGVNSTVLGLTTEDYLIRAVDGLWVPMTVVACAALVVVWGHEVLRARLAAGASPRLLRVLPAAMAGVGLVLAVAGLWSVFADDDTRLEPYLAGTASPVSLALGVLLLAYAVHLRRALTAGKPAGRAARPPWAAVAEWAAVFVLVGLSLFWAATNYSYAVGITRARQHVRELAVQPGVVVYSQQSLSLAAPGVSELRCRDPEASYRFRYDGLTLLLQSGDQYVFLPATWSRTDAVAILLPRNDSVRLEFSPRLARGPRPPAC